MTKFKKIVSGTLAGCLMASVLMMSAGAANVHRIYRRGTAGSCTEHGAFRPALP